MGTVNDVNPRTGKTYNWWFSALGCLMYAWRNSTMVALFNAERMNGVIRQYMKKLSTACGGEKENDKEWNEKVRPWTQRNKQKSARGRQ